MWNEFMEWVDEWDNPIPIPDSDEENCTEEQTSGNKILGLLGITAAFPIGALGYFLRTHIVAPLIKTGKEKVDAEQTHAATEWIRANLKNKQQKTAKTLQGNGNYWEVSRRKTNSKNAET